MAGLIGHRAPTEDVLARMGASLIHRGPDDHGIWIDQEARLGLAHRRLSIVDLSPAGHQPMVSSDGRYVIAFNGEIYNHGEIRRELEDRSLAPAGGWRGHSDTETLLEAIVHWGLRAALDRCVGMFAFGLWDRHERMFSLVRDRFGEKPLYYGWVGPDFVFASELKAFRALPKFQNEISRKALALFASRNYIPAPYSIYERIFKLPPASILTVDATSAVEPREEPLGEGRSGQLRMEKYWSYEDVVAGGLLDPIADESDAIAELDNALSVSVAGQSIADVPVGMFLSGGIDSSTIAALYQRQSSQAIRTFSIGFEDAAYDEAPFARRVAERLGAVHEEAIITERDALGVIPLLPGIYDEPFADSSQIPTYLVSSMTRKCVKVALTGDGGDELFGGYYRHFYAPRLWRNASRVPAAVRAAAARPLSRMPPEFWNWACGPFSTQGGPNVGRKIQKALRVAAGARRIEELYDSYLDEWRVEGSPVLYGGRASNNRDPQLGISAPDEVRLMYCDAVSYLPGDILCKVDRASMAVSLETRVPFLDHRVAEVAARIPLRLKIAHAEGKKIVRKLLYREAPAELFKRSKTGFAMPVAEWLAAPLRDWAEELLSERRLSEDGWFDARAVRARWSRQLTGRQDSAGAIWAVLMFQAWLNEQKGPADVERPTDQVQSRGTILPTRAAAPRTVS